ncbi:caspase family protein [Roseibium sp.]|uniref:caspase family protein n=1 Tax=Roseibium sp. TaxID=1936156 RepID=UPI0032676539
MMFKRISIWLVIALSLSIAPVLAAERVALVIGNGSYRYSSQLPNPQKDASDVAHALRRLGFEVIQADNLDYGEMRRAFRAMDRKSLGADMAVIYYAGHGIEVDKTNYIVPVDAQLENDRSISYEAIPLDLALQAVAGATKLKLVIVDACRDNPFLTTMQRTDVSRSLGRGLASVEPTAGTLVVYSAKEGTVALDGASGTNSPFAAALLSHIEQPGLEINFLFRKVRDDVLKNTRHAQQPFTYGSLPAEQIYLIPPAGSKNAPERSDALDVARLQKELADIKRLLQQQQMQKPAATAAATSQNNSTTSLNTPIPTPKTSSQIWPDKKGAQNDSIYKAKFFTRNYNENWSLPNNLALGTIKELYADRVNYYGKLVSRNHIFLEKKRFAERWPDRIYAVRWESIQVTCNGYCEIEGIVDWYARSLPRGAHSSGAATVQLTLNSATNTIHSESSSVLDADRKTGTPSHIIQNWYRENDACRGGSGDRSATLEACERRDFISIRLKNFGWCYGRKGETGSQHRWHHCDTLSMR